MTQFKKVAVGGTFDQLHRGHKALISKAFEVGEKVVIGLSSDEFVARMGKPHKTATYTIRRRELVKFLRAEGFEERALIVPLKDPLGLMMSKDYDALVVSQDTAKIGSDINQKRLQAGVAPLQIITVTLVPAENCSPISTTRIRRGEIDRNGHLLAKTAN
ncbi:MAG: phosphopantetheine adenylyltransferase [Candidatus Bathyarchaeia archaeon]|jgi:pantetheine-phosphate adenylyltransferase